MTQSGLAANLPIPEIGIKIKQCVNAPSQRLTAQAQRIIWRGRAYHLAADGTLLSSVDPNGAVVSL